MKTDYLELKKDFLYKCNIFRELIKKDKVDVYINVVDYSYDFNEDRYVVEYLSSESTTPLKCFVPPELLIEPLTDRKIEYEN